MNRLLIILSLFYSLAVPAQTDNIPLQPPPHGTITAHIKGHLYESNIERDFFQNNFELVLSDTSYKIAKYNISWTAGDQYTVYIFQKLIKGPKMVIGPANDSLVKSDGILAFDNIIIQKGMDYYKVPAFVIYLSEPSVAIKKREHLALCYAYVSGSRNNNLMVASAVSKGLTIELTDTVYKMVSFDAELEDPTSGEIFKFKIKGNALLPEENNVKSLLTKQSPGCTIIIDNIKAEKDGKLYSVNSLPIYLK